MLVVTKVVAMADADASVVFHVRQQHVTKMSLAEYHDLIDAYLRIDRSAYPFCHRARGTSADRECPLNEVFG
jgi:hypothetical protein